MKKIIFLLTILGCLLFCGCSATTDIEYGIDTENNSYIQIKINVNAADLSDLEKTTDLQTTLRLLESYYRTESNFKSEYDFFKENENNAYLTLTKTVASNSFEEAFENLKEMLCDESLSVFSELSCELSDTDEEYAYRINGKVDLHSVLENTYSAGLPKGVADHVSEQLKNCSLSVTMVMPENSKVYRLSFTEPTEISHKGRVSCIDGVPTTQAETNERIYSLRNMIITCGVLSVISLTGITVGIAVIRKRNKLEPKQVSNTEDPQIF